MGNEQSQEASTGSELGSDKDDFDLSQIEDTRRDHQSSPQATPEAAPRAASPIADTSNRPSRRRSSPMATRKRKTKTKANSKKKRRQSRDDHEDEDMHVSEPVEGEAESAAVTNEETRLVEEIMLRERSQRVRRLEPEMFDEYAMSEPSEIDIRQQESVLDTEESPAITDEQPEVVDSQPLQLDNTEVSPNEDGSPDDVDEGYEEGPDNDGASSVAESSKPVGSNQEVEEEISVQDDGPSVGSLGKESKRGTSSDRTTSINSIFDGSAEGETIAETPVPKRGKRKRDTDDETPDTARKVYKNKKLRKSTPPTSPELDGDILYGRKSRGNATLNTEQPTKTSKSICRQSSMEDFTVPFLKGSDFRHPVYNPKSPEYSVPRQRVEVIIPAYYAGPSTLPDKGDPNGVPPATSSSETPGLKRRNRNGTPSTEPARGQNVWDLNAQPERQSPESLARAVARKAMGGGGGDDPGDSSSDYDNEDNDGKDDAEEQRNKNKRAKGKERARSASPQPRKRAKPDRASGVGRKKTPSKAKDFRCTICGVAYATETLLDKHLDDPAAHDHLQTCGQCNEQFPTRAALIRHAKESGHGANATGATGRFTSAEEDTILRWRNAMCKEYDLNHYEFNEVMVASAKKTKADWPYKFMTKADFQKEYYSVLPDRDRRSMQRYRKNFQNVDKSREFTEEDDADIMRLVEQLGPRWTEIADSLTRDAEAVRQRYKNKLAFGNDLKGGEWEQDEKKRFDSAIKEIRRLTTSSEQDLNESTFNWTAVSHKVQTRSAKQCADHWRAKHGKNVKGIWVDAGTSLLLRPKTPSKMERRLAEGELSSRYVDESEDGEDADKPEENNEEANDVEDESRNAAGTAEEEEAVPQLTPSKKSRKPALKAAKTPKQAMTATQAFEHTQAHTSGLKASSKRKRRRSAPSQEQPSPGIAMQTRPDPNPEFDRKLQQVLAVDDDGTEDEEDQRTKSPPRKRKQQRRQAAIETEDQSDAENAASLQNSDASADEEPEQETADSSQPKNTRGSRATTSVDKVFSKALGRRETEARSLKRKKDKKNMKATRWPEETESEMSDGEVGVEDGLPR